MHLHKDKIKSTTRKLHHLEPKQLPQARQQLINTRVSSLQFLQLISSSCLQLLKKKQNAFVPGMATNRSVVWPWRACRCEASGKGWGSQAASLPRLSLSVGPSDRLGARNTSIHHRHVGSGRWGGFWGGFMKDPGGRTGRWSWRTKLLWIESGRPDAPSLSAECWEVSRSLSLRSCKFG